MRPRLTFKSQLSTMTANQKDLEKLSDFATDRNIASLTLTEKKNKSVMQEMKNAPLEALHQDSLDQTNQLTTREWVRVRETKE